ncbi:MAG: hypothetical protein H6673_07545 [Anaerolineales bacterium]|nr:hypothetical protein [Anaerolineales bacterium]
MFGSAVLDTAVGLVFVFFVVSTICSNVYTMISRMINTRGKLLSQSLIKLLGPEVYAQVMRHPLIRENHIKLKRKFMSVFKSELDYETLPDYIDPDLFARALAEILAEAGSLSDATKMLPGDWGSTVEYWMEHLKGGKYDDLVHLKGDIERWFNEKMDALTTLFKRQTQWFILAIAVGVTLVFNLNAIAIGETLWKAPTVRDAVVASASEQLQTSQEATPAGETTDTTADRNAVEIFEEELSTLGLPVGWTKQELAQFGLPKELAMANDPTRSVPEPLDLFIGWAAMVGAAMFGAPFWFDLLRKIVSFQK